MLLIYISCDLYVVSYHLHCVMMLISVLLRYFGILFCALEGLSSSAVAVDVLHLWFIWICLGAVLGRVLPRGTGAIRRRGVHSTPKGGILFFK